jgi:predicted  nucleic acid-binding Zn-ribbon protein
MTDQQSKIPQFTIAEVGAKFGEQQAQAYAQIITLEKQLADHVLTIQSMTKNEARLQDHIEALEVKISEFTQQEYDFVDRIQELEAELAEAKPSSPAQVASLRAAVKADEDRAIANKKAAR